MLYFALPLILSLAAYVFKNKKLDYFIIIFNAVCNAAVAVMLVFFGGIDSVYIKTDALSRPFLLLLAAVFSAVSLYSVYYLRENKVERRWHSIYTSILILFNFLMMLAIMSTHIGMYWVLLEATTLLTAPLIYFDKTRHSLEATWKYVFICSIGIAIAFIGIIMLSITFHNADSLFFADIYSYGGEVPPLLLKMSFLFLLVGFGTKMGLAPLHFWLPDAHSEAPAPVSAMLSATLLNTAFIGILRVQKAMNIFSLGKFAGAFLMIMGFISLFVSAVFIIRVKNYKRIFAYSSVENIGIMAIAAGMGGAGFFACFIHMMSHSLLKASAFLTTGNLFIRYRTKNCDEITGLAGNMKYTAVLLFASVAGLLAIPPSLSFISEFRMLMRMLERGDYMQLALFLILLTVIFFGFSRMLVRMVSFKDSEQKERIRESFLSYAPQIALLLAVFILGVYMPRFIVEMINEAARWMEVK